jgi:hypothetical protein
VVSMGDNSTSAIRAISLVYAARWISLTLAGYEAHGLLAGALVFGVDAARGAGDGHAPRLLDPLTVIQRWLASATTIAPWALNSL